MNSYIRLRTKFIQLGLRKTYRRIRNQIRRYSNPGNISLELERLRLSRPFEVGYTNIFGKPFKYHSGRSFADTYQEIFEEEIYQFRPSKTDRIILDCGANMGLSVLYFSRTYPDHQIIAFEPDKAIFKILEENVATFNLKNVRLYEKAVWTNTETLTFYTDGGMGGRVQNEYANQAPVYVETVPLLDFLSPDVDFLKIDIEGAEDTVLRYCGENLQKANNIFFEYHNNINTRQTLHELLALVQSLGFTYYIKESAKRTRPFTESRIICESFDMALNVFCYRNKKNIL